MTQEAPSMQIGTVEVPPGAPRLRITAGSGSPTQKTWNVRRPVTLIGSRRPAHIVLHDRDIDEAHCVIVNTGREFLLKDLHTRTGTTCNGARVDLTIMNDGDVIMVGQMRIQVAIQPSEESNEAEAPTRYDPTTFQEPIVVNLVHTQREWKLRQAVSVIGRLEPAEIRLDDEEVSRRHAVIFRFRDAPVLFDLGGRGGVCVEGKSCTIAALMDGHRVTVGPFCLQLGAMADQPVDAPANGDALGQSIASADGGLPTDGVEDSSEHRRGAEDSPASDAPSPDTLDPELASLKVEIADAWQKLNSWPTPLLSDDRQPTSPREPDDLPGTQTGAEDAAYRGQLHDLTRLRDRLAERERKLDARSTALAAREAELATLQAAQAASEDDLAKRVEDVTRRERVVAQRWSRLLAATCAKCGHPFTSGENGTSPTE